MGRLAAKLFARLVFATRHLDNAYRRFDLVREETVLALGSDAFHSEFCNLAYNVRRRYRADTSAFERGLFPWETEAIERYFPPPPARVLVGAAGGGREPLALAEMGYKVVAFDPAPKLAALMAGIVPRDGSVQVYRAAYEDLPRLYPAAAGGAPADLAAVAPFDAGIIGWGSYAHLRGEGRRLALFRSFAQTVRGPILMSYLIRPPGARAKPEDGRLGRLLTRGRGMERNNAFWMYMGFAHYADEDEIRRLAGQAGLSVEHLHQGKSNAVTDYSHAVLMPALQGPRHE